MSARSAWASSASARRRPRPPRSGGAPYRVGAVPGRRPTNRPPVSVGSVRTASKGTANLVDPSASTARHSRAPRPPMAASSLGHVAEPHLPHCVLATNERSARDSRPATHGRIQLRAPRAREHAAPVVPRDRADLVLGEPRGGERVEEPREPGDVAELVGHRRPVEVGAERDVLDPDAVARRSGRGRRSWTAACRRRRRRRPRMNGAANTMPTSPPDAAIASSCASVRLRVDAHRAWTPECEAISGAPSSRATSQKPASLRWLRSTAMPSSAQRRTSRRPAAVRPGPVSGEAGNMNGTPWANAFGRLHTGPASAGPRRTRARGRGARGRSPRRPRGA